MKIQKFAALFAVIGLSLVANTALGQGVPPTTEATSTAVVGNASAVGEPMSTAATRAETVNDRGGVSLMSAPPAVDIRVVPILAPPQNMASFWPVAIKAVNDTVAGQWTTDSGYYLCQGKISATNVVYYKNGETPWLVLQTIVDVRSVDGENTISLNEIIETAESVPPALNGSYQVGNHGYGEAAVGIQKDGTRVTNDSPNKKVARIVFVVQMGLFVDDPAVVRAWVLSKENFTVNYTVKYGTSVYVGRGTVSILGYGNYRPELVLVKTATGIGFMVIGGDENRPYDPLSTSDIMLPCTNKGLPPVFSGDTIWPFVNGQTLVPMDVFYLKAVGW